MDINPYEILGISENSNLAEIKSAYRKLAKLHHPDAGGDQKLIQSINAAWEILRDPNQRKNYDQKRNLSDPYREAKERGVRNARASAAARVAKNKSAADDEALIRWLKEVYVPIDKLLGGIINAFPHAIRTLSADPYDDSLMEVFCSYLDKSKKQIKKIRPIFQSMSIPRTIQGFGLSLYQCFSQAEDALNELERYTMGYVDNYLHDGRAMLLEAKRLRLLLKEERKRINVS